MSGKIFIVYRRDEALGYAGRLHDLLENRFGRDGVFMDLHSLLPGQDFLEHLQQAIARADIFLVIIGPTWSSNERLAKPNDFVRYEINAALQSGKPVIPVLVDNASIPRADELPEDLKPLRYRQAIRLGPERFRADAEGLLNSVADLVAMSEHSPDISEIQTSDEDEAWLAIRGSYDPVDIRDFLARFPDSPHLPDATAILESLSWQSIRKHPNTDEMLSYREEFPNGSHVKEVSLMLRQRLEKIKSNIESLQSEASKILGNEKEYRQDVFISYSKETPEPTEQLAQFLRGRGLSVWYDTRLVSGDEYARVIRSEIYASRAVIVIWTESSIISKWVYSEAQIAETEDKLVPVRAANVDPNQIPMPFNADHSDLLTDEGAILKALSKKGVLVSGT